MSLCDPDQLKVIVNPKSWFLDDVRDRHCQDGWEEQGPFLDLGGEVTTKMKLLRPIPVDDHQFSRKSFPMTHGHKLGYSIKSYKIIDL